ncbi:hypothetical protein SLEP1_g31745 [Rubroshorea leprosula]|uniref:Transmembrane protein n=1 Tax=Rubroshorea leprosula TaxID=152421 RepID=A0AAV5K491_9ROSI|nr:hypothetical protein SLEP1_g31745 [Rubroshorea leprosula]
MSTKIFFLALLLLGVPVFFTTPSFASHHKILSGPYDPRLPPKHNLPSPKLPPPDHRFSVITESKDTQKL